MSQRGIVMRCLLLTQEGGSNAAAYPTPQPPKQIKSLIQTRPLPAPQPLSSPPGHIANCDQEAAWLIKH